MFSGLISVYVGHELTTSAVFYDTSSVKIVPTTVTFKMKTPAGVTNSYTVSSTTTTFSTKIFLNEAGTWKFRWEASGTYAAADEFEVNVKQSTVE